MSESLAYLHGRLVPLSQAVITLHDAGFVQGVTVTDMIRTFRHRPYRLREHLNRFRQSCRLARIPLEESDANLKAIACELIDRNAQHLPETEDLGLVLIATPGPIGWYLGESGNGPPTLGMHTFPLPFARYRNWLTQGVHLRIPQIRHFPADSVDRRIKHRSRLFWWLAEQEVRAVDPNAHALLLDDEGCVTETAAANFLIVTQGRIVHPPTDRTLGGISLSVIRELCDSCGIPVEERLLRPHDCCAADEAMLTCTTFCLAPVARLDDHIYPSDHPLFARLLAAWSTAVGLDIRAQILKERPAPDHRH